MASAFLSLMGMTPSALVASEKIAPRMAQPDRGAKKIGRDADFSLCGGREADGPHVVPT